MMKFAVLFALLVSAQAQADIYSYEVYLPGMVSNYLSQVSGSVRKESPAACAPMYTPMIKDGVLDVHYAFGYFDDSRGVERVEGGINYGYSPSLDLAAFRSFRRVLIAQCVGYNSRLCGFSEVGDFNSGKVILQKYAKIQGQKVLVRITMTQASASESWTRNKGDLAGRQRMLTLQSEENFFDGLKTADVVFYNGHSRNGGGPDFNMPVLNSHMKTDYDNYYEPRRIGIKRTLLNLQQNPNKGFVLGLFSCYSRKHFLTDFQTTNSSQRLVLSADTVDYFDTLNASAGYLEGMMHGLCGKDLSNAARQGKVINGFQDFNF